jgi:hypothetical protein
MKGSVGGSDAYRGGLFNSCKQLISFELRKKYGKTQPGWLVSQVSSEQGYTQYEHGAYRLVLTLSLFCNMFGAVHNLRADLQSKM